MKLDTSFIQQMEQARKQGYDTLQSIAGRLEGKPRARIEDVLKRLQTGEGDANKISELINELSKFETNK